MDQFLEATSGGLETRAPMLIPELHEKSPGRIWLVQNRSRETEWRNVTLCGAIDRQFTQNLSYH